MQRRALEAAALLTIMLVIAGCASSPKYTRRPAPTQSQRKGERPEVLYTRLGLASYYGDEFLGRETASGEIYTPERLTAAHRSWPFGTKVRVINMKNKRSVVVVINDRGPFKPERIIDLSRAAAVELGMLQDGVVKVKLEVLDWGEEE